MTESRHRSGKGVVSSVSGIVLAGGKSRRMGGITKALLEIGGKPIIERTTETLARIFSDVLIITNSPSEYEFLGLPMYSDLRPGFGAIGGLHTGLSSCSTHHAFFVACDMPFLNDEIIRLMASLAPGHDIVIPRIHGLFEPLHAIYSRACVPPIEKLLDRCELKILNFFNEVDVLEVDQPELEALDPELRFIMNLNTPEDLAEANRLAERLSNSVA